MTLPIRTTIEDVKDVCVFLAKKPTGASAADAKKVLDPKRLDGRKLSALKQWKLIDELDDGKLKVTANGRKYATGDEKAKSQILTDVVREVKPYCAIIERAAHRGENTLSATDVAAHWHEHFVEEVSSTDQILNDQAVCFFQVADGAGLGKLIVGRKGQPTRFEFSTEAVAAFSDGESSPPHGSSDKDGEEEEDDDQTRAEQSRPNGTARNPPNSPPALGQAIFVAHGKNKKPLEQLKHILDQFKVPYRVAADEPHLGRPISQKVRETMHECNCAVLIFTADEEFTNKDDKTIWRPSENVVHELGASGYLYDKRIVILKEEGVTLPSNFSDLGYISFAKDQLDAKAMEVLKELIGFGIVKIST
jgi:predicted nucleotide-binding protein